MKSIFITFILVGSFSLYAKNDMDLKYFNKAMAKDIEAVITENPHLYETKPQKIEGRIPASVQAVDEATTETLDSIDEQADTHTKW
jgi:hypothetical protein